MKADKMRAKLLIVTVIMIGVGIAACKKDQYTTKPQLTFKSVNGTDYRNGELITFKLELTDKEGDVQDSLWIQKISTCPDGNYEKPFKLPDFPVQSSLKADVDITYIYGPNGAYAGISNDCAQGSSPVNDTCYFKFWVRDKAKNTSDTIQSPKIVLIGKK
jgi:hypothetical protein